MKEMELYINGKKLNTFNDVDVMLRYDSIADTFSFKAYFNPESKDDRAIFRPLAYHDCVVKYNGKKLITGTTLINAFRQRGSLTDLVPISGYSKSGILNDCTIHPDTQTLQLTQRPTLEEIVKNYIQPFGISVTVDKSVEKECKTQFNGNFVPREDMIYRPVGDILAQLCSQQLVILSHDRFGNLLLTKPKADKITKQVTVHARQIKPTSVSDELEGAPADNVYENSTVSFNRKPIYRFDAQNRVTVWTEMQLVVNGQLMHYQIVVDTERDDTQKNTSVQTVTNPLVSRSQNRVRKVEQRDGNSNTTALTARAIMGQELQAISLVIEIVGWELNNNLVTPNSIIVVNNHNIYLYKDTRFFITQVDFKGSSDKKTATLTCVLPETFNDDPIKDIFG